MENYFNVRLPKEQLDGISSLGLAHMGDAVYEIMVRAWLCAKGGETSRAMHTAAVSYVSAPAQAAAYEKIAPLLDKEEYMVYKRGRNARVHSVPQHASLEQYHAATGLEALMGYLYLNGRTERLSTLFNTIMGEE